MSSLSSSSSSLLVHSDVVKSSRAKFDFEADKDDLNKFDEHIKRHVSVDIPTLFAAVQRILAQAEYPRARRCALYIVAALQVHFLYASGPSSFAHTLARVSNLFPFAYVKCAHCWLPRRRCLIIEQPARASAKTLWHCTACKSSFYCSLQCQRADWTAHKAFCKSVRSLPAALCTNLRRVQTFVRLRMDQLSDFVLHAAPDVRNQFNFATGDDQPHGFFQHPEHDPDFISALDMSVHSANILAALRPSVRMQLKNAVMPSIEH